MADSTISDLDPISVIASNDLLLIVDVSATTSGTKKVAISDFLTSLEPVTGSSYLLPSGDTTGATDQAAIQAALAAYDHVTLSPGTFYIDDTLDIVRSASSLCGTGFGTKIQLVAGSYPAIQIGTLAAGVDHVMLKDFWVDGVDAQRYGTDGVLLENASYIHMRGVRLAHLGQHGLSITGNAWDIILTDCDIWGNNGNGINSVGDGTYANGNHLCLQGTLVHTNVGTGITWTADGLNLTGCLIEDNQSYGVHITTNAARAARGVNITGCYFEGNGTAQIAITGTTGYGASCINIAGNIISTTNADDGCIVILGDTDSVSRLRVCTSNSFATAPSYDVWENGALSNGELTGAFTTDGFYEGSGNASVLYKNENGSISFRYNSAIGVHWGRAIDANSWRLVPSGNNMEFQRYESSVWVTKAVILSTGGLTSPSATISHTPSATPSHTPSAT